MADVETSDREFGAVAKMGSTELGQRDARFFVITAASTHGVESGKRVQNEDNSKIFQDRLAKTLRRRFSKKRDEEQVRGS